MPLRGVGVGDFAVVALHVGGLAAVGSPPSPLVGRDVGLAELQEPGHGQVRQESRAHVLSVRNVSAGTRAHLLGDADDERHDAVGHDTRHRWRTA
jgi:hypothetical protein